jgi:hypothetical protein
MNNSIVYQALRIVDEAAKSHSLDVYSQEIQEEEGEIVSGFIDIGNETFVGRVTVWSTNECICETIESNSEIQIYHKRIFIATPEEINPEIDRFIASFGVNNNA